MNDAADVDTVAAMNCTILLRLDPRPKEYSCYIWNATAGGPHITVGVVEPDIFYPAHILSIAGFGFAIGQKITASSISFGTRRYYDDACAC